MSRHLARLLSSALVALCPLALAACGAEPIEPPPPSKAEAVEAAAQLAKASEAARPDGAAASSAVGERSLVPIEITWKGIGPLYKGFFSTSEPLTELSYALEPHLNGPVQLELRYDSAEFIGAVHVLVPPGGLKALPAAQDGQVDLQALAPITEALATYRSDISGRYDVRIQSFAVGLDFFRGPLHCSIGVAGTHPPDGRMVSPCVSVNGAEVCGNPKAGGVAFNAEAFKELKACLGS